MAIDSGPHDIDATRVIFTPSGAAVLKPVTPDFYESLDEFGDFLGHALIQRFSFDAPWGMWEMHPEGDEFVYLLAGDTDFLVKFPGQPERRVRVSEPGSYVMVPQGAWHTAEPHAPTTMLFVTPGAGTLNRPEPE